MSDSPKLVITALGNRGSGKTTFLLGMYAELSAGLRGYFLNAMDPDADLKLADMWDRLLDTGELPPPNTAEDIPYEFLFLDGVKPIIGVDWLDYRGGALDDRTDDAAGDVAVLHERLTRSDCIFLVVDGGYLIEPITAATRIGTQRASGLRRMTQLVQNAVRARLEAAEPPPSLVVVITKTDLIPPQRREMLDALCDDIRELLPICFSNGLTTLIAPVMLGNFGSEPGARVDPYDVNPHDLHLPIIFSLAEYSRQLSILAVESAQQAARRQDAISAQLTALSSGSWTFFRRSAINAHRNAWNGARADEQNMSSVGDLNASRAAALFGELAELPLFRDGIEAY